MEPPRLDDAFLRRQQQYYADRAPEYDDWWERRGRYDRGPEANDAWFREREVLYEALDRLPFAGNILEPACGTGIWTRRLAPRAAHVTAVDGSPEMLALNRARTAAPNVTYLRADLFAWEPDRRYDAVVLCFWLSHVPPERLDAFLRKMRRALAPAGRLFFADSRRDPHTTSADQPLPERDQPWLVRRLDDGRRYPIVKVFYAPDDLRERFSACGLRIEVRETPRFFLYGWGGRDVP